MADVKISAMPVAPDVLDADVFPSVQAGVNYKANRVQFLVGEAAGEITVESGAGGVAAIRSASGNTAIVVDDGLDSINMSGLGFGVQVGSPILCTMTLSNAVGVDFTFGNGVHFNVLDDAVLNGFTIDAGTGTFTIIAVTACIVPYFATTPGDWAGASPTEVKTALDRCAALLKVLNAGVGP